MPNGVHVDRWRSLGDGRGYTLGPTLEPLSDMRDHFQVVSGLAHRNGTAGADGAGDHARATATILTGMRPRKTAGSDIRVGISVDQLAVIRRAKTSHSSAPKTGHRVGGIEQKNRLVRSCWQGA